MGWFSKLFSRNDAPRKASAPTVTPTEYKGYLIYPEATPENGQYRVCGRICKRQGQETLTHQFIRSDLLGNQEDANSLMLVKAKMTIDQNGDRLF